MPLEKGGLLLNNLCNSYVLLHLHFLTGGNSSFCLERSLCNVWSILKVNKATNMVETPIYEIHHLSYDSELGLTLLHTMQISS